MVDLDIERIELPTDWVSGLVIIKKPNAKLHICLAPRPLNNAIKREHLHFPLPRRYFHKCPALSFSQN